jgi:hypothetical protein
VNNQAKIIRGGTRLGDIYTPIGGTTHKTRGFIALPLTKDTLDIRTDGAGKRLGFRAYLEMKVPR